MAYSTTADVRSVLSGAPSSTVTDASAAELTDEQITREIENADSEIDAMLAAQYSVPFSDVPTVVSSLSIDIAAYLCDLTYRVYNPYNSELNPLVLRYQRARSLLMKLSSGDASIEDPSVEQDGVHVVNPYEGVLMHPSDLFYPRAWW